MIRKILRKLKPTNDFVIHEGLYLPLNRSNENLSDNTAYLNSGIDQLEFLINKGLIKNDSELLDFGCGQGRLLNTLEFKKIKIQNYVGLDTSKAAIDWCTKHLKYSNTIDFVHLPAANARYNPNEKELKNLPFKQNQFDLIFLNSVFSHMLKTDIVFYLSEFEKILKEKGNIYLTAFIEENVTDMEENPEDYLEKSNGALHRVRYEKNYFFSLVDQSNLKVVEFHHQHIERTKQSVLVLQKQ